MHRWADLCYNKVSVLISRKRVRTGDAELMELADMQDLGSCAARRMGSSPIFRRKEKRVIQHPF